MGLLSFFKRNPDDGRDVPTTSAARETVQQTRTRARRRLIGAVVLVAIGIIGFPLLFESTPRPIPIDIPIEIPARDAAKPLAMPPARAVQDSPAPEAGKPGLEGPAGAAPAAQPSTAATRPPEAASATKAAVEPAAQSKPATSPAAAPAPDAETRAADGARAKALLEGRAPPAKDGTRYVVQVGAFADSSSAQEIRQKAEKLGMKTYTQVVETSSGKRIRVRLGPFDSRGEAEKVLAKAKAAGFNAAVMPL